jgi:hypothetical protein
MANPDPLVRRTDAGASTADDWPARAAALVVRYVDSVRNKTTGPALKASRYLVYVAAIALIAVVVAVIGLLLTVRLLVAATAYAPGVEPGEPWLAYLVVGGIFLLGGVLLWRKKEGGRNRA